MEEYLKIGQDIYETYCSSTETRTIMLPKAPQHTYIDIYPDEDEPGPSFRDDKKRQSDYETEVLIYRALEGSEEDIIVLHNFEYTHHQYRLCDKRHVRKGCHACRKTPNNVEGECDFLIIGKNYFLIIEVKSKSCFSEESQRDPALTKQQHKAGLQKSHKESMTQRKNMVDLIKSIERHTNIRPFTAYPNFSKKSCAEFDLKPGQLSSIIFKEDTEDFASWWNNNVSGFYRDISDQSVARNCDFRAKYEKVRNMLLAIWCTDNNGHCDKTRCSLGWCIKQIDDKLRSGKFTFESSKRNKNPNVIPAVDIIREYLGVNNLTKEQFDAFNSKKRILLIHGPAGTGKSVILIAKAIQLAKSNKNRKIIFFSSDTAAKWVKTAFERASVSNVIVSISKTALRTMLQMCEIMAHKLINYQAIIIEFPIRMGCDEVPNQEVYQQFSEILNSYHYCDLFVDDLQVFLQCQDSEKTCQIMDMFGSSLSKDQDNHHICISCDIAQGSGICKSASGYILPLYSSFHTITLSKNLRNTYEISKCLSVIRDHIRTGRARGSVDFYDIVQQTPGHFIRGPKINIHVFKNDDLDMISNYLDKELCPKKMFWDSVIQLYFSTRFQKPQSMH